MVLKMTRSIKDEEVVQASGSIPLPEERKGRSIKDDSEVIQASGSEAWKYSPVNIQQSTTIRHCHIPSLTPHPSVNATSTTDIASRPQVSVLCNVLVTDEFLGYIFMYNDNAQGCIPFHPIQIGCEGLFEPGTTPRRCHEQRVPTW